jgi:hypothetical protein
MSKPSEQSVVPTRYRLVLYDGNAIVEEWTIVSVPGDEPHMINSSYDVNTMTGDDATVFGDVLPDVIADWMEEE